MNFFKLFIFRTIGFRRICLAVACLLWLGALAARATDRYVSPYGTNDSANGYTNWVGAATNIQDAVSKTTTGDKVWVTNGVYYFSTIVTNLFSDFNTICGCIPAGPTTNVALLVITNGITVQSMNGPTSTIIDGYQYGTYNSFAAHCVFLAYPNSFLSGFTIQHGNTTTPPYTHWGVLGGAGVHIHRGAAISNCIITSNKATHGGGMMIGASGNVWNCTITSNEGTGAGGGLYLFQPHQGVVRDSTICDNVSTQAEGGGILFYSSSGFPVTNCMVTRNTSKNRAGIQVRGGGTVANCQIVSNISLTADAGGYCAYVDGNNIILNSIISYNTGYGVQIDQSGAGSMNSSVKNCLISSNSSYGIYVSMPSNLVNVVDGCTVVKNGSGGIYATGRTNPVLVLNSIIYSNSIVDIKLAGTAPNQATNTIFYNCCATNNLPATQGNITNNPQFVDWANGNYRLRANSPCVNTGTNQDWMTNAVDLGGRARIRYGTVDMGAYEVIYNGTIFKF